MTPRQETWAATLLFVALAAYLTWPQAATLATHAYAHYDVYFNLWRLAWAARAWTTAPTQLLDGNIFYPESGAMLYSDAMIVEGLLGTPLHLVGMPPLLVHNLLLLGAIVSSATGVFVLARHLTGSAGAGVLAGVIFAFVPYRFDHYMHLELQWTVWMPWAFWALHRTLETHARRDGWLTGLFVSLQMLSSIYYGVFLVVLLGVIAGVLLLGMSREAVRKSLPPLSLGALVAAVICGAYARPYLSVKQEVGGRDVNQIAMFSAQPSSYLIATPDNTLYGQVLRSHSRSERRLFPGLLAVTLAGVALFARQGRAHRIAYLLGIALACELSLGLSGFTFGFLFEHVSLFQGFRAIARVGIFVLLFLAVLAAHGYASLVEGRSRLVRRSVLAVCVAILLMEYRVSTMHLVPFPNTPPPLYAWLADQPRGVVAEMPLPWPNEGPALEPRFSYMSTFHWQPLVNGYSGFAPPSYVQRLQEVSRFPDVASIERLRRDNVRYLVVHLARYKPEEGRQILGALGAEYRLPEAGRFGDGEGEAVVFLFR